MISNWSESAAQRENCETIHTTSCRPYPRLLQSQERIPKLSELLEMVDGRVPLIVEIKAETADVSCCVIIDKLLHAYRGAYCIESFNPMVLWWFRRNRGSVVRGQLSSNFRKEGVYWNILYFAMTICCSIF